MRIAVVRFPGSNADWDSLHASRAQGADAYYVFHKEDELKSPDAVILPGGFSYGDYLRAGAIAGFSPIVGALRRFAESGGPVLGICNGFQILTELNLLPGALTRNAHLRFECGDVHVRVESTGAFTSTSGQVLKLPIAHADGRYQASPSVLSELAAHGQIALRYCAEDGSREGAKHNPNGSVDDIAGIYNREKNVLGLMPHPERASEEILGNDDGKHLFAGLSTYLSARAGAAS